MSEQHFRAIHDIMQSPDAVRQHLITIDDLCDISESTRPILTVDEAALASCIDPVQPTIGLRPSVARSYGRAVAIASQQLRLEGEPACNIIMLPELAYGREGYADGHYYTQRGIIIDETGQAYGGDFFEPVVVDVLSSRGNDSIHELGVVMFINDPRREVQLDDKLATKALLIEAGIATPGLVASDVSTDDPAFLRLIARRMEAGEGIVIKPVDGSLGQRILIADPQRMSVEAIIAILRSDRFTGKHLFAEEQIVGPPTYAVNEARLDWNVRSLVANGTPIGHYARVGLYGEAVNVARGAIARSVDTIVQYSRATYEQRRRFMPQLEETGRRLGALFTDAGFLGPDTQPNRQLQPFVIEVNGERAGGMHNITAVDPPEQHTAKDLARAFYTRYAGNHRPVIWAVHRPLIDPTSPRDIVHSLTYATADNQTSIGDIIPHVMAVYPLLDDEGRQAADTFLVAHQDSNSEIGFDTIFAAFHMARRRLAAGQADAMAPLNNFADYDRNDMKRQATAAQHALQLLGQDAKTFLRTATTWPEVATPAETTWALGRVLALHIAGAAQRDIRTISSDTYHAWHDTCAQYLRQPATNRSFPNIDDWPAGTEAERAYMSAAFEAMHLLEALSRRQYDDIRDRLLSEITTATRESSEYASTIHALLALTPPQERSANEHSLFILSCLALHGPVQARRMLGRLEQEVALEHWQLLVQKCEIYSQQAGLEPGTDTHATLTRTLTFGIQNISVAANQQAATEACHQLLAELDSYPELANLLRPNLEGFIANPGNFVIN